MGLIGVHVSIAGGIYNAVSEGNRIGCEAIQVFTANQRTWNTKQPSKADVEKFIEEFKKSPLKKAVSHDSYLINLASINDESLLKSRNAFLEEMERTDALKLNGLVFHPGSFTGGERQQGLETVADSLNYVFSKIKKFGSKLLLENTAGSGSHTGGTFEEIAFILKKVKNKDRMGVCLDTAHMFESGYDIKSNYKKVLDEFDRVIGLGRLECFHVNDSKTALESHADRHEHIGQGHIGIEFFRKLINDKRFKDTPMIMETPDENDMDIKNVRLLKSLRK
jgi:deoxyribonuclease-4